MLTKSHWFLHHFAIDFIIFWLIKILVEILVFFLPDDTLEQINETGPWDVVHMFALIQKNGVSKPVGMQDLLRENLSIVVEVIDSESAEVTWQEDVDITIAWVAMELALDVFPESTMTEAQCDIVGTEIISEFTW